MEHSQLFQNTSKDFILILQICYGPLFLNTIIEVTNLLFDVASIQKRKINEETLKLRINEELKKLIPNNKDVLQNQC